MVVTVIANGFQEDYTVNLVNALAESGIEVDFIGSDIYLNYEINKRVNFLNLRGSHIESASKLSKIKRIIRYYLRLLKYSKKAKHKVFHIQWLRFYYFEGVLFSTILKLMGKRIVYTVHDVLPHSKETPKMRKLFKKVYRVSNHLIAHTGYIKKRLVEEFHLNQDKIAVVKHGVYNLNLHDAITKENARSEMKISKDDIVLLFFGYITEYKGLPLLFDAFKQLERKHENIKLLVAGKVSQEYKDTFDRLRAQITSDNVQITTKYLDDLEVEQHYKASDIVVLPYLEASQSGVMFISYAYGKPVIAPNFGGFPYDIIPEKTGLLFERQNTDDLTHQINRAIDIFCKDSKETSRYITDYATENYSWEGSAKALKLIYKHHNN
ncbi:MAG TPA: hypothetical protein DDX98_16480 [Bacteroidales bacterium]|jgi:glycosyltransferase involved in cell wall biosynthesis|nr:hypothetical protein [Bacteroidales bacterium]